MKKIHIALSVENIASSVEDYSNRLECQPCVVIKDEYALWRTNTINFSIRKDMDAVPGSLRHMGWEDCSAGEFSQETDVNGLVWERFSAPQQADEINEIWPSTDYRVPE